eukprot:TRINITY_DN14419_c0_g1_i2.p1 TRINITY_DN14419_c0_g1~~TRINITY_DN14419_c0_g1_i2.p1  ORF type:complete len:207 (-),score=18.10 TRINITY_DN14419_c0_g1_i2:566-1186(-)
MTPRFGRTSCWHFSGLRASRSVGLGGIFANALGAILLAAIPARGGRPFHARPRPCKGALAHPNGTRLSSQRRCRDAAKAVSAFDLEPCRAAVDRPAQQGCSAHDTDAVERAPRLLVVVPGHSGERSRARVLGRNLQRLRRSGLDFRCIIFDYRAASESSTTPLPAEPLHPCEIFRNDGMWMHHVRAVQKDDIILSTHVILLLEPPS